MLDKPDPLVELEEEFARWQALLAPLDTRLAALPTSPGRTVKDDVGHLAAWQERSIARLEAAAADREPVFPGWPADFDPEAEDVDQINDWIFERYRDRTWTQVYDGWRDGYQRLLELATAVPPDTLGDRARYAWLDGYSLGDVLLGSLEHHREHYEELRPLLAA